MKKFAIFIALVVFLFLLRVVKATDADYYANCYSHADCGICGSGECQGYYKCIKGYCTLSCTTDRNSCTYTCPPDQCQGYMWCDYPESVSGTCSSGYCWGNCSPYSCTCVVGYCNASGTYYKSNPWSGNWNCCDSQTDCVDYNGNCIDSGGWSNGDNHGPVDYCSNGEWISGWCAALNSTCLQYFPYTNDTYGCSFYSLECPPYDVFVVIAFLSGQCFNDDDCPGYDPNTHLKLYCDPSTYTCKPLPSCSYNSQCEPGWCCDRDPKLPDPCRGSGVCVQKGSIMCNNQYICDPPEDFDGVSKLEQESKENPSKKLTLLDLLANLFHFLTK